MSAAMTPKLVDFQALDECHQQIQVHLAQLSELAQRIEAVGVDAAAQHQAGVIEAYFSGTSRQHHAEEERSIFPPLLASGDAELVAAIRTLQQDHGWIEENWIELAPQLRAIASGNNWFDAAELQHCVIVFLALCQSHIMMEETLIYPEARARLAKIETTRFSDPRM
ncbi:MAG: hemerythrin domain-containing protein [Comamonadaceae bacterium]